MGGSPLRVRPATAADAPALAAIYGDACLHGVGTFEEVPPGVEEMTGRPSILRGILAVQVTRSGLRRTAPHPPTTASAFVVPLALAESVQDTFELAEG
jgi:hypothetical protein